MEHGEKDLAHLLKEFAPVNGSMSGGLTDAKTKFYWEEMLEAVQVAHQVIIIHTGLVIGPNCYLVYNSLSGPYRKV